MPFSKIDILITVLTIALALFTVFTIIGNNFADAGHMPQTCASDEVNHGHRIGPDGRLMILCQPIGD